MFTIFDQKPSSLADAEDTTNQLLSPKPAKSWRLLQDDSKIAYGSVPVTMRNRQVVRVASGRSHAG